MAATAKAHDPVGSRARSGRLRGRVGAKGGDPNGALKRRVRDHPPDRVSDDLPLSRSGLTPLGGRMVIVWTRATSLRGSGLYSPPISKKCVAHLATHFLPAGSRKAFEMTVQRHAGADTGSRAPVGKGSGGGTGRAPPFRGGEPAVVGGRPVLAHRGARSDPAPAGAGDGCQGPCKRDDERAFETPSGRTVGATPVQRRPVCVGVFADAVRRSVVQRSSTPKDDRARAKACARPSVGVFQREAQRFRQRRKERRAEPWRVSWPQAGNVTRRSVVARQRV